MGVWGVGDSGTEKEPMMSLDLFMNDTCPKCRKLIKLTAVERIQQIARSCAQVGMRRLRARNQQDLLPQAERCRFLNKAPAF